MPLHHPSAHRLLLYMHPSVCEANLFLFRGFFFLLTGSMMEELEDLLAKKQTPASRWTLTPPPPRLSWELNTSRTQYLYTTTNPQALLKIFLKHFLKATGLGGVVVNSQISQDPRPPPVHTHKHTHLTEGNNRTWWQKEQLLVEVGLQIHPTTKKIKKIIFVSRVEKLL